MMLSNWSASSSRPSDVDVYWKYCVVRRRRLADLAGA